MDLSKLKIKKRRGFTLAEMVMVVTILGILSSMALMKYSEVQKKAQENADYIAASSLATAVSMAAGDNNITNYADGSVNLEALKTSGYIVSVPKPQSEGDKFLVKFDISKDGVTVTAGSKTFYPKAS